MSVQVHENRYVVAMDDTNIPCHINNLRTESEVDFLFLHSVVTILALYMWVGLVQYKERGDRNVQRYPRIGVQHLDVCSGDLCLYHSDKPEYNQHPHPQLPDS